MRFISTIFASLLLMSPAFGAELHSRVTSKSGEPLPSVSVITDVHGFGTQTDDDGWFTLKGSKLDEALRVTISCVGYVSRQFTIDEVPEVVVLEARHYRGTDILVRGDRAETGVDPVAFSNVSRKEIERDYAITEFPVLLESTPNFFAYTDGGSLGYSYASIRGFDDKRITTYINGVPLNDPEDQATYFFDLPDFAANVDDIQVQRGVGNSLYGDASFGGSINIVTNSLSREQRTKITSGVGAYERTGDRASYYHKQSVEYSSGLIDGRWHFSGRFSRQNSDGYRENSWYRGWSYYFSLARLDPKMTTELYIYGGPVKAHLAYWGSGREDITANRFANPLTYRNETDNFNQPHYHLHNTYRLSGNAMLHNTLYYIHGNGYYEQYKDGRDFAEYNIDPSMVEVDSLDAPYGFGDLVRQQWVTKNQIGWTPRLEIRHERGSHTIGGSMYYFESDHHGEVVWAQHIRGTLDPRHKYYQYFGKKWQGSFYVQEHYELTDRLSAQATGRLRFQSYDFDQEKIGAFAGYQYDVNWLFFSPRLGLNYKLIEQASLFGNFAVSSRTPTDASIYDANDPGLVPSLKVTGVGVDGLPTFGDPTAKNERVYDFELGGTFRARLLSAEVNLFWMEFRNEIIPEGGVDDMGLPITTNADRSMHSGIETALTVSASNSLTCYANFSYNYNRIKEYVNVEGLDFKDKTTTGFPDYIGNAIVSYDNSGISLTGRLRFVGRRYVELWNIDDLSLDPYAVISVSAGYTFEDFLNMGRLTLTGRIDNLGDKKYEFSGYGGNWKEGASAGGWAEYFVAPERTFFGQISLELF